MRKEDGISVGSSKPIGQSAPDIGLAGRSRMSDAATVGRTIRIKGEVTGDEDLLIEGRVEGSVNLASHSVTVGPKGNVKASIVGRVVTIKGKVQGNLTAEEQIVLLSSASVEGDLAAPRVVLEDGAYFRGGVDMSIASAAAGSGTLVKQPGPGTTETRPRKAEGRSEQASLTVS